MSTATLVSMCFWEVCCGRNFSFAFHPLLSRADLENHSVTCSPVGTALGQCCEDACWVAGTQGCPMQDPGVFLGSADACDRSEEAVASRRGQVTEVSINQVINQLISCQPSVSRDL